MYHDLTGRYDQAKKMEAELRQQILLLKKVRISAEVKSATWAEGYLVRARVPLGFKISITGFPSITLRRICHFELRHDKINNVVSEQV